MVFNTLGNWPNSAEKDLLSKRRPFSAPACGEADFLPSLFFNIKLPFFSRSLFPVAAIIAAHRAIIVDQLCILMIAIRQIQGRDKKCIHLGPKMGIGVIVTKLHQLLDNKGNPHQSAGCFKQQPLAETAKIHPIWLEGVP